MVDGANFYTMSILYPLVARATYPRLSFPGYPGEVAADRGLRRGQGNGSQGGRGRDPAHPRDLPRVLRRRRTGSSAAASRPSIADIRLVCTLEFLAVTDTELPDWTKDYMQRVESALGDAYSEPAGDVRGYIAQVTGEAVATS